MLVSIIIPVYNVAAFIGRCIDSVISQTYTGDMECILVDDCGEDNSIAIAQKKIENYQGSIHFRILVHDRNRGLSAARNTGINASRGDYLFFLDSDDWLESHCISSLVLLADYYPGVEMVQAGAFVHGGGPKPWLNLQNRSLPEYIQGLETIKALMLNRNQIPVTAWNRLVKKDFLLSHNLCFQEGLIHEDELWTYQLAKCLSSLAILKKNVYHYEYHESGLMATTSVQKSYSLVTIAHQMIKGIDDCCQSLTVSYVTKFIQLRSFDILEESQRIALIGCIEQLYNYFSCVRRLNAQFWLALAKLPIRNHYWLYSLLYHWKI